MPESLRGLGVSPGVSAGPVLKLGTAADLPEPVIVTAPAAELARAAGALVAVAADLTARADQARDDTAAEVLRAQAMMAADPMLDEAVAANVTAGQDAPHALASAFEVHRAAFAAAGGLLAERVTDLDDLRDRAVAASLGRPMPGIPTPGYPFVLVARDLAPADTALLDPGMVLALITEEGGPTSHTAIIARAAGIPAVVGCPGALELDEGVLVAADGGTGQVTVGLTEADAARIRDDERVRRERLARSSGPGRTADWHRVALLANIGSAQDLRTPAGATAEGVGLFRTELLYLGRTTAPGFAEQVTSYAEVFTAAAGRPVVVRTLDAGADKPLAFLPLPAEPNPALGVRGLRTARRHSDVLDLQLQAIAQAAADTNATVKVMAPMVSTAAEAAGFVARCRAAGLPSAGVMVEVPAAALQAGKLAGVVDFLSIGTNDLSQYTFAADRQAGDLAELLDPWQPALLTLISMCAAAGQSTDTAVGVCGEAAADPALALVLTGLGVTSLSMSPLSLAQVRESLGRHTLAQCRHLAELALGAEDGVQARELVTAKMVR
jgi:phosphotransferase system enzyme I (PtsI)